MSFEPHWQTITTPDGRALEVVAAGPEDGRCFLWHSGTPSSAGIFAPALAETSKRGLRFVAFSRPGYATSTARPGRSVGDVAGDVTVILDALGFDSFICAGQSGGGPHALACAALLPDRVLATATLAGAAPWPAEGLDWMAGMGPENVDEYSASMKGLDALTLVLERDAAQLRDVQPEDVAAALGGLVGDVDKQALTGEYAGFVANSFRRAVSAGIAGWRDDDMAFVSPWGFDLSSIITPVAVWQGGEDRMVPMPHGAWLASHIAGAEQHLLPAEGHLSLAIHRFGDVLDGLLSMAETAPRPAHA
jgi:pimeloyl-ACP methyl ester carboxylesterase